MSPLLRELDEIRAAKYAGLVRGLMLGLAPLFGANALYNPPTGQLGNFTNLSCLFGVVGCLAVFLRLRGRARHDKALTVAPLLIGIGIAAWSVGQVAWMLFREPEGTKLAMIPDLLYAAQDSCWIVAIWMLFLAAGKNPVKSASPIVGILGIGWTGAIAAAGARDLPDRIMDTVGLALTLIQFVMFCALAAEPDAMRVFGRNGRRCLLLLGAASVMEHVATMAYVLSERSDQGSPWAYTEGGYADVLLLIAVFLWTELGLALPLTRAEERTNELDYDYDRKWDLQVVERAQDVEESEIVLNAERVDWLRQRLPGCMRIISLGESPVGCVVVLPISKEIRDALHGGHLRGDALWHMIVSQREFDWTRLMIANVYVRAPYRNRGFALRATETIFEHIADWHSGYKGKCIVYRENCGGDAAANYVRSLRRILTYKHVDFDGYTRAASIIAK